METKLLKNFSILFVEDDVETADVTYGILKQYFKEVYLAYNGKEALNIYQNKIPDIVLTDIFMPYMDGLDLSKEIRKINSNQTILILSAHNESNYLLDAINIGINKFILKPINKEILFNTLIDICKVLHFDLEKEKELRCIQTQKRVQALNSMLKNISHQWRQPLSVINLNASYINLTNNLDNNLTKENIHCLNKIVEHTYLLSSILEDFTSITNNYENKKTELNLKSVLLKCKNLLNNYLSENNIELIIDINDDISFLENENIFIQAILNILNNSINAFLLNKINNKYIVITANCEKNKIILFIKDNAGGIDESIIDNVFDPFFTTKHQYVGIGLGLSMAYEYITTLMGGIIKISNCNLDLDDLNTKGTEVELEFHIL